MVGRQGQKVAMAEDITKQTGSNEHQHLAQNSRVFEAVTLSSIETITQLKDLENPYIHHVVNSSSSNGTSPTSLIP